MVLAYNYAVILYWKNVLFADSGSVAFRSGVLPLRSVEGALSVGGNTFRQTGGCETIRQS